MANIKISDLTAASAAADANEFEINEAGTSKKVTGAQISALVESNLGLGALATLSAVGTTQITDGSVTTAKLGADAVDGTKIADDAIDSEHYAAGSIDAEHIADSAVTAPKVAGADGTATQVLQSDGDGTMSWVTLAAGGGFSNMQVFTSPGTWTNPGNVEKVKVTVVGGGGSGGGAANGYGGWTAGGGGGAGTAIEVIPFPTATNVPVTVGNGGPLKNVANGNLGYVGNTGGTSSFGAYCSATGGEGGRGIDQPNAYGDGGAASGGTLNITGGPGTKMWGPGSVGVAGGSFMGFGGMGDRSSASYTPVPGTGYGGGGAGATTGGPGASGSGSPGVVIVEY